MKPIIPWMMLLVVPIVAGEDLQQDVRCREIAFSQSAENRDAAAFASFIDADARFIGGGVSRGVEAVAVAWAPFFDPEGPHISWRPQFVEVLEDGTLALSRGPYRMTTQDEAGNTREHWGTFNSVWRLQADKTWKVVFDAGNAAPEPPAAEVQVLLEEITDCSNQSANPNR